jgi:glycolate oxidase FAD binding subunit
MGTRTERPRTVADAAALLAGTDETVLLRGAGTQLDWAGRVEPGMVLDTAELTGVLTYEPADMTTSVRAGTPLTALQEHLADNGQWVALDPPTAAAGATVGGLLAAGDAGPSRLRYGGLREHVIGVTLVLADGTIARSGGHVIKNVAGYDMAKLVYGSLGSLAMVAEVVLRVHPRPAATVTAAGPADVGPATAAVLDLMAGPQEPAAVEWIRNRDGGRLLVRFDGPPGVVEAAHEQLAARLRGSPTELEVLSDEAAAREWSAHAELVAGADTETVLRVCGLPTDLPALAADVADTGVEHRIVSSVALGVHTVAFSGPDPLGHAAAVEQVRKRASARGDSVLLRHRQSAVDSGLEVLGPPPSTVAVLRRIKAEFDPSGRLGPGRFAPWY